MLQHLDSWILILGKSQTFAGKFPRLLLDSHVFQCIFQIGMARKWGTDSRNWSSLLNHFDPCQILFVCFFSQTVPLFNSHDSSSNSSIDMSCFLGSSSIFRGFSPHFPHSKLGMSMSARPRIIHRKLHWVRLLSHGRDGDDFQEAVGSAEMRLRISDWDRNVRGYPLVNIQKTMENHHV